MIYVPIPPLGGVPGYLYGGGGDVPQGQARHCRPGPEGEAQQDRRPGPGQGRELEAAQKQQQQQPVKGRNYL